jgi:hypothetical protein
LKLNRIFVRFNRSESAFQFLVLLYFFCASEAWIIMGLIDWSKSLFKSQQIKQIEVIPHKKLNHRSLAQSNFENWKKKPKKNAVHPKIHLKSHQFQSDKWKFQFTKAQSSENTENLQKSKTKQNEGHKPTSKELPSYSFQKIKIKFEIP